MQIVSAFFEDRVNEINAYVDLLEMLENQVQEGVPRFADSINSITPLQQKIMYSSLYIQLYSLVEATITQCIEYILLLIKNEGLLPANLSPELQREWVRYIARTHEDLNYDNRLNSAFTLCQYLVESSPIQEFQIDIGGGGNWDDISVYKFSQRIGLELQINSETQRSIKRKIRDELGLLQLIREYRNKLAHGNLSFAECGESISVEELKKFKDTIIQYLREVIQSFQSFVDNNSFKVID